MKWELIVKTILLRRSFTVVKLTVGVPQSTEKLTLAPPTVSSVS